MYSLEIPRAFNIPLFLSMKNSVCMCGVCLQLKFLK